MSKHNLVSRAVRMALLCGVASGLATGSGALAADQDQNADATQSSQLGRIEVTGTKIKRTQVETAQPIVIVTAQQIKASGLATIGQILQRLTSSGAALNTLDNFGGNFTFTGGGQSNMDLRYLGAQRVLVLVNGKRWVTSLDGTVDMNTIPAAAIDHIEVLQDGASAIYGSDAISGVVNIITVKNYNGREASAYLGMYNGDGHWDGKTQTYDFTYGASNDQSGLVFNASYSNQNGILSANRDISKEPVVGAGPGSGSSATPSGRFVFIPPSTSTGTDPNNTVAPSTGLTATQCPTTNFGGSIGYQPLCDLTLKAGAAGTSPSDFRPFVSGGPTSDRFNYAPYNYVLTPEERFSTYIDGHTDLADNLTFTAGAMYSHRDSQQQAAPEPLFFASSSIAVDIPGNQKYNPFGFDLNAGGSSPNLLLLGRRMVENGARLYHEKEDTFHFNGGFNGYFNAGGGEWDWDAYYVFSKDSETDMNAGHFDVSHLRLALGDPTICAAVQGCVPINMFGGQGVNGTGSLTPAQLAYVGYTAHNLFENNQRIYAADISNSNLANLPAGPLGFAAGYQYLEHDGSFEPDSVAQNGYDSFNPGRAVPPTIGRTVEKSEYVEFDIPLLSDVTAVKSLDLDVARRHTNYSSYGGNDTNRAGIKWLPNDNWLVRASWSQGYRAPSINDLFSGPTNLSSNILDPCTTVDPSTGLPHTPAPSCGASGVPAGYKQPNGQINTLESGNPNLQPETSISQTFGFVYSPDALPGFNLNVDYYKIDLENTIQPISGQAIMDGCYYAGNVDYCNRIHRTVFGTVQTLDDSETNVGSTITEGIDYGLNYAFPTSSVGDFKLVLDGTHIQSYRQILPNPTGAPIYTELAGVERGGTVFPFGVPKDKVRTALDWSQGAWSAEWAIRFIQHMGEVPTGNHIGATTYHDVQANYEVDSLNTTFTFGIRNLFAKEPPISAVQELNSFDPTLYDVPGRFLYVRASAKF